FYSDYLYVYFFFFFFQAEDGIRDFHVTGVQTCALPISIPLITVDPDPISGTVRDLGGEPLIGVNIQIKGDSQGTTTDLNGVFDRSEERRVGKECRSRWSWYHEEDKKR